jgi:hypothetical protein
VDDARPPAQSGSPAPGPAAGEPPGDGAPAGQAEPRRADALLTLAGKLKAPGLRTLRRNGRTTLAFAAPGPGSVRFDLLTQPRGGRLLARGAKSFRAAGSSRFALVATAGGRAWLRRHPAAAPYGRVVWRPQRGRAETVVVHLRR